MLKKELLSWSLYPQISSLQTFLPNHWVKTLLQDWWMNLEWSQARTKFPNRQVQNFHQNHSSYSFSDACVNHTLIRTFLIYWYIFSDIKLWILKSAPNSDVTSVSRIFWNNDPMKKYYEAWFSDSNHEFFLDICSWISNMYRHLHTYMIQCLYFLHLSVYLFIY